MVPAALEKVGSVVQRLNIEDVRETDTTCSSFGLKLNVPSAALIGAPLVLTTTRTVKVLPVEYTPVAGVRDNVEAYMKDAGVKSSKSKNRRKNRFIYGD
jgi:hypothetical protein